MIPILGFLPPDDERVRATVLAIADELTEDGLVLRYKVDTTDTGFEGKEGTFTICSFWLVTALAMIGEEERARALCQKLLAFAGPLQLYAEEIDAATGRAPGQLPPGLHPPGADRRGRPAHRGRARQGAGLARGLTRPPRFGAGPLQNAGVKLSSVFGLTAVFALAMGALSFL